MVNFRLSQLKLSDIYFKLEKQDRREIVVFLR